MAVVQLWEQQPLHVQLASAFDNLTVATVAVYGCIQTSFIVENKKKTRRKSFELKQLNQPGDKWRHPENGQA